MIHPDGSGCSRRITAPPHNQPRWRRAVKGRTRWRSARRRTNIGPGESTCAVSSSRLSMPIITRGVDELGQSKPALFKFTRRSRPPRSGTPATVVCRSNTRAYRIICARRRGEAWASLPGTGQRPLPTTASVRQAPARSLPLARGLQLCPRCARLPALPRLVAVAHRDAPHLSVGPHRLRLSNNLRPRGDSRGLQFMTQHGDESGVARGMLSRTNMAARRLPPPRAARLSHFGSGQVWTLTTRS